MAAPSPREAGKAAFNRGDYAAAVRARGARFPRRKRPGGGGAAARSRRVVSAHPCAPRRWSITPPRCARSQPRTFSSGASRRTHARRASLSCPRTHAASLFCNAAATARWRTWRRARRRRRFVTRCPPLHCGPTASRAGTARHASRLLCCRCLVSYHEDATDAGIAGRRARRCRRWAARGPPWWRWSRRRRWRRETNRSSRGWRRRAAPRRRSAARRRRRRGSSACSCCRMRACRLRRLLRQCRSSSSLSSLRTRRHPARCCARCWASRSLTATRAAKRRPSAAVAKKAASRHQRPHPSLSRRSA